VAVRGSGRRLPPVAIGRIEGRVERIVRFKGRRKAEHVDTIINASIDAIIAQETRRIASDPAAVGVVSESVRRRSALRARRLRLPHDGHRTLVVGAFEFACAPVDTDRTRKNRIAEEMDFRDRRELATQVIHAARHRSARLAVEPTVRLAHGVDRLLCNPASRHLDVVVAANARGETLRDQIRRNVA